MPRQPGCVKTGGRGKGVPNKPKPIKLSDTPENRQLVLMAPTLAKEIKTPKSIMLAAMMRFDDMSRELMAKAQRMAKGNRPLEEIRSTLEEAYRFTLAAVKCASDAAPYIHARLLAVESRGVDNVDSVPYVLRSPMVMPNSAQWQEAVQELLRDREATEAMEHLRESNAPRASGSGLEAMSHPASPTPLKADPTTSRITVMPPGPRTVQPSGTEEWLASIKLVG
jgi:hypothetical protein